MSKGLAGVMTWDADNDAKGVDGNAQWAYSLGIIKTLNMSQIVTINFHK